jgi:hypothetical protein
VRYRAWNIFSVVGLNSFFAARGYTFFLVFLYSFVVLLAGNGVLGRFHAEVQPQLSEGVGGAICQCSCSSMSCA